MIATLFPWCEPPAAAITDLFRGYVTRKRLHVVDGAFPSDLALSSPTGLVEEQRLFYVAATRARDELAIDTPLRMPHHRRALDD